MQFLIFLFFLSILLFSSLFTLMKHSKILNKRAKESDGA